jgi:protein tyrosine phosphatase (PTP) superfamily phosphohydrolase (DUF442 family)
VVVILLTAPAGVFVGYRYETGNIGTVEGGRVYRSAQLSPRGLKQVIRKYQIKSVINLRGANPDQPWYQTELQGTLDSSATQVDVPIASDQWLSHEQVGALLHVLDSVEYPVLIHCEWGAERTGLVSAVATLLRPGGTMEDARKQFSAYYLFINMKDGRVMYGHLIQYERWLSALRQAHSPSTFRAWLEQHYRPEGNSRELWSCNPYPLEVVTRRTSDGTVSTRTDWSPNRCPRKVAEQPKTKAAR